MSTISAFNYFWGRASGSLASRGLCPLFLVFSFIIFAAWYFLNPTISLGLLEVLIYGRGENLVSVVVSLVSSRWYPLILVPIVFPLVVTRELLKEGSIP